MNQPTSLGFRLLLLLLLFSICAGLGALSHLSWLAVAQSPVLASALIMVALSLGLYLYVLRRRYQSPAKRRPIEELARDLEPPASLPQKETAPQPVEAEGPVIQDSEERTISEEPEPPPSARP